MTQTMKPLPNKSRLDELMRYDPETGEAVWVRRLHVKTIGKRAGSLTSGGYLVVGIDGDYYLLHRLIFPLMGVPISTTDLVDHINGIKTDNRWENLRIVTHCLNMRNVPMLKTNTSGYAGVHKDQNKWRVQIRADKKTISKCGFKTAEAANLFAIEARKGLGFTERHGK